jgi:hypothetical protein
MGAITALAVIGSALGLLTVVSAIVLCHRALRDGGELEAEISAPLISLRMRAKGRVDGRSQAPEVTPRTQSVERP